MTNKMFVYYSGTVAAFKAAALEATYENSIVFISGDAEGKGAAIYTHNKYFANITEAINEALSNLNYFSSIKAGGVTATANGEGTIEFSSDSNNTVEVVAGTTGIKIGLSESIQNTINAKAESSTVNGINSRLQTVEGDYLKGSDKEELEGKIGDTLAEAKKYTDDEVSRIVADSGSGLIGSAEDTADKNTIYGAKKYAAEAAAAAQTAAEATAAADATSKVNAAKEEINGTISAIDGRVSDNEAAIATLNGDGNGSVKKQVADAIASVVDSAPEDFDTLKEVAEWIASDTSGAAKMQIDIARLDGADTVDGSVKKQIKDAVAAEASIARAAEQANAGAIEATEGRLDAIEADYLKGTDKTELQNNINAVSAVANAAAPQATTYTKTEVDGLISASEGKLADYYKKSETYSKEEVDAMWAWAEL